MPLESYASIAAQTRTEVITELSSEYTHQVLGSDNAPLLADRNEAPAVVRALEFALLLVDPSARPNNTPPPSINRAGYATSGGIAARQIGRLLGRLALVGEANRDSERNALHGFLEGRGMSISLARELLNGDIEHPPAPPAVPAVPTRVPPRPTRVPLDRATCSHPSSFEKRTHVKEHLRKNRKSEGKHTVRAHVKVVTKCTHCGKILSRHTESPDKDNDLDDPNADAGDYDLRNYRKGRFYPDGAPDESD